MQELTGQYSQLYTRKFRVSYTDWQPSTQTRRAITLFNLANGYQVTHVMVVPVQTLIASSATSANLRIMQSPISATANNTSNQFVAFNAFTALNTDAGVLQSVVAKTKTTVTPNYTTICNKGAATTIFAVMDLIGGANMNSMTAGQWDVYVTTIRLV